MLPYPCRVELSCEWSNCVAISVYARLFTWIELSVTVKRTYVNNNNCDSYSFKFTSLALASSWLSGRILDWRLSQPGFDPSFANLACLATLMSSDRTKQTCLWMTVYILFSNIRWKYLKIYHFKNSRNYNYLQVFIVIIC